MLLLAMMLCMSLTATASAELIEFIRIGGQQIKADHLSGLGWEYFPNECKLRLENAVIDYNQHQAAILATMSNGNPLLLSISVPHQY